MHKKTSNGKNPERNQENITRKQGGRLCHLYSNAPHQSNLSCFSAEVEKELFPERFFHAFTFYVHVIHGITKKDKVETIHRSDRNSPSPTFRNNMLVRFRKLQKKWKDTLVIIDWTMVFVSVIISLLPILINCDQQRRGYPSGYFADILNHSNQTTPVDTATVLSIITDDDLVKGSNFETALIVGPFLGMCLPALLDLLIDLYVIMTQPTIETNSLKIVRLSLLERFVFIVGVVCNAFYFLFPMDWNVMVLYTIRQVMVNLNTLLSTAPLIMFLERTTSAFSPFFTSLVICLLSLGGAMSCFQYNLAYDTMSFRIVNVDYQYLLLATYILIISACLWSFLQSLLSEKKNQHFDPFHNFTVNHVPACHMVALCLICAVSMCWYLSVSKLPTSTNNILWTLLLFASSLVFVIEMRIRQNEFTHGLHLLNSKRSFVRFISHEVNHPCYYIVPYTLDYCWSLSCIPSTLYPLQP